MTSQYRHRRTSVPATPFPTLEPGEIAVNTANRQLALGDAASGTLGAPKSLLTIRFFDISAQYATNDYVVQNGIIYRANAPISPGAFNASNWTVIANPGTFVLRAGDTMTGHLSLPTAPAAANAVRKDYVDAADAALTAYIDAKPAALLIGDTPPPSPAVGTLWWESDSGLLYIYYNDGTSSQWVIASPQPDFSALAIDVNVVHKIGDTMTGPLVLSGNPTTNLQAAPKQYVDSQVTAQIGNKVDKAGDTMSGHLALPTGPAAANAVRKDYVDSAVGSIDLSSRVAKAGDTMSGALTINNSLAVNGPITSSSSLQVAGSVVGQVSVNCWGTLALCNSGGGTIGQVYVNSGGMYFQNVQGVNTYLNLDQGTLFNFVGSPYACKSGGGAWSDFSDIRIKNITGDYTRGLDDIVQLHPVNYVFKGNDTKQAPSNAMTPDQEGAADLGVPAVPYPNSHHYHVAKNADELTGLIAQEVREIFPEMVREHPGFIDGEPVTDLLHLDTTPLIFALINSVKELKARVEALEAGSA